MSDRKWVKWNVVCQEIGITRKHLDSLRWSGSLKQKVHYINVGLRSAARPSYRYNLETCREYFNTPPEKR